VRYSYEPVPSSVEPELAEYLTRQFNKLANSSDAVFVMPTLNSVPDRAVVGGLVYVVDDGVYACVSATKDGDAEWVKVQQGEDPDMSYDDTELRELISDNEQRIEDLEAVESFWEEESPGVIKYSGTAKATTVIGTG
jgi:hypothetical protein